MGGGAAKVSWAQATQGSVGRSLPLSTTLRQPALPLAQNSLSGVVTKVAPGEVDEGDVVYVVGDVPVRVVQGEEPFWRDLAKADKGVDVEALQRVLIAGEHLTGQADGDFGPLTERAVKAWQKAEGRPQTGVVRLGELVAVRDLPAVVQLGESIVVGKNVGGGEDSVLAPTGQRQFVLVVTQEQARLIPAEARVEITYEDHTWEAIIASSSQDEYGSTTFELSAPDGGEVCEPDCSALPAGAPLLVGVLGDGALLVAIVTLADVLVRRKDLGRRRALGATRGAIVALVVLRTLAPALLGAAAGVATGLWVASRLGAGAIPPWQFTAATATLALLAAAAAAIPPAF